MWLAKNAVAFGVGTLSDGPASLGGTLKVGRNYNDTSFYDGLVAGLIISPDVLADADFDAIRARWNTKFGLAL